MRLGRIASLIARDLGVVPGFCLIWIRGLQSNIFDGMDRQQAWQLSRPGLGI